MDNSAKRQFIDITRYRTDGVKSYVDDHNEGVVTAPRTIENAIRRGQLKFYQIGNKRYTTPEFIDEWLESLVTTAK
jgi:hypothetical protein